MKLTSGFAVGVPIDIAWPLLLDVPKITPCVPGASLSEDLGDGRYRGNATVKIGPVQLQFAGEVVIVEIDHDCYTAKISAKGMDKKGRGNATAAVHFALEPLDTSTKVQVLVDLQLTGSVAQYGRAEGLIRSIAAEITRQFAQNLQAMLDKNDEQASAESTSNNSVSAVSLGIAAMKSSIWSRLTHRS